MWWTRSATLYLLLHIFFAGSAQDTLPKFSVTTKGNDLILIRWKNNKKNLSQVSIQRSHDSVKNFRTIYTPPDPTIPTFSYVDSKAPTSYMYYRLFILIDSVEFYITPSQRVFWDTGKTAPKPVSMVKAPTQATPANRPVSTPTPNKSDTHSSGSNSTNQKVPDPLPAPAPVSLTAKITNTSSKAPATENKVETIDKQISPLKEVTPDSIVVKPTPIPKPEKQIVLKKRDSIVGKITESKLRTFIDSLINKTKDTFVLRHADTLLIKPFIPKEIYKPSSFIFTDKDGNVLVQLPDVATAEYSIDFYDEKGRWLFAIGHIKDSPVTIDKVNFLQSGWYRFELKQNGQVKEKNKFFIPRDL